MSIQIITTESGSRYEILDGTTITRLSEIPILSARDFKPTDEQVVNEPVEWIDEIVVGHPMIMRLAKGPLRTSPVTEIKELMSS